MNKKNSWRVALDYYNQEKNAPVFKIQKYEGNDLYGKSRHEGYKAWQLSASYAPEKKCRHYNILWIPCKNTRRP